MECGAKRGSTWVDEPIRTLEGDELNFSHVAIQLAQLVSDSHSSQASLVFGLTGRWGSGKTSLIEMTCDVLRSTRGADGWKIVHFTPWSTHGSEAMLEEFYSTISPALPKSAKEAIKRNAGRLLSVGIHGLRFLPAGGDAIAGIAQDLLVPSVEANWHSFFEEMCQKLIKDKVRVLVVVDDVDRLQRDELVSLLKVVRLLGRFPGLCYLLAYDEETLFWNLQHADLGVDGVSGARLFMEKIVQYSVPVPPLLRSQVLQRLSAGFSSIADDLDLRDLISDQRLGEAVDAFESQLVTPRSIDRFLAQAKLYVSMHDAREISVVDLILLTFIRLQFPETFDRLTAWKWRLTSRVSLFRARNEEDPDWRELVQGLSRAGQDDAMAVLGIVFPKVVGSVGGSAPCASSADYFDRYFVHTVPADDVPDVKIAEALAEACLPESNATSMAGLLTQSSAERSDLAVKKLAAHWEVRRSQDGVTELIRSIVRCRPGLSDAGDSGQSLINVKSRLDRWLVLVLASAHERKHSVKIAEILSEGLDLTTRLRLLFSATESQRREATSSGAEIRVPSPGLHKAVREASCEALAHAIEHLREGDQADTKFPIEFYLSFVAELGDAEEGRRKVAKCLGSGSTIEDLAARCIVLNMVADSNAPELGPMNVGVFQSFAPGFATRVVQDYFSRGSTDVSWDNRRRVARVCVPDLQSTSP